MKDWNMKDWNMEEMTWIRDLHKNAVNGVDSVEMVDGVIVRKSGSPYTHLLRVSDALPQWQKDAMAMFIVTMLNYMPEIINGQMGYMDDQRRIGELAAQNSALQVRVSELESILEAAKRSLRQEIND